VFQPNNNLIPHEIYFTLFFVLFLFVDCSKKRPSPYRLPRLYVMLVLPGIA